MTLPIDLVYLRHGESEGNLAKRHSEAGRHGSYNAVYKDRHTRSFRLTAAGRGQAGMAGDWLRGEFGLFDQCMVSEYARAMETAVLLGLPDARWRVNDLLTERNWGDLDRCSEEERKERFADELRMRTIEPFFWSPPSGESLQLLRLRLDRVLQTLHRECSDKRVLIVCHGEVMWTFRIMLERMPQQKFRELHFSRSPEDRLFNCDILHYTRRDPQTGRLSPYVEWFRRVRPTTSPVAISAWQHIERAQYTNEELLSIVSTYPAVIQ
jgi:NAD+ kinase